MTSTDKDILGERTALEDMIADFKEHIELRSEGEDPGSTYDYETLGPVNHKMTIGQARTHVILLGNVLAKYRAMDALAKQSKNPPNVSEVARARMISSATMIRSVRELLTNVILAEPAAVAINRGALLILDSAVEHLERND